MFCPPMRNWFSSRHRGGRQSARESPGSQSCRCGSCEKRITQCRMLPSLDVEAIRLDDAGHDIRQRFIARNGPENFLARDRMGTRPPARVDGDGIHNLSVNSCFEPAKADVGGLMVAAACGATRPVNREGIHGGTYFIVECFGEGDGPALRFDESEITIIRSNASHQSARKRGGERRYLFEQGLFQEFGHAIRRNIGNNRVLPCCQANLAVAINVCQARKFVELIGVDPAGGNAKADSCESRLFLRAYTEMVGVLGAAHVPALERELVAQSRDEFSAQAAQAPLLDQKSEAALGARLARAMVAVNLDQLDHHCRRLENFYKHVQR